MAVRSRAAVALKQKLSPPVMNQTQLAKQLGVSQAAVWSWLKGRALPEAARMAQIESLLGIPMRDWVEASDEADESGPQLPACANEDPTGTEG